MYSKAFDADRYEVRAAVVVLLLAAVSILAGWSQARAHVEQVGSGVLPMLELAAENIESR